MPDVLECVSSPHFTFLSNTRGFTLWRRFVTHQHINAAARKRCDRRSARGPGQARSGALNFQLQLHTDDTPEQMRSCGTPPPGNNLGEEEEEELVNLYVRFCHVKSAPFAQNFIRWMVDFVTGLFSLLITMPEGGFQHSGKFIYRVQKGFFDAQANIVGTTLYIPSDELRTSNFFFSSENIHHPRPK